MRLPPSLRIPEINRPITNRLSELERRRIATAATYLGRIPGLQGGTGDYVFISTTHLTTPGASGTSPSHSSNFFNWSFGAFNTGGFVDISDAGGVVKITEPGIYSVAVFAELGDLDALGCIVTVPIFLAPGNSFTAAGGFGISARSGGLVTPNHQQGDASWVGPLDRLSVNAVFETTPGGINFAQMTIVKLTD